MYVIPPDNYPRAPLAVIAEQAELGMREHDDIRGVTGWRGAHPLWLLRRLIEEVGELSGALAIDHKDASDDDLALVTKESADVVNLAMMVADSYHFLARGEGLEGA